MSWQFHVGVIFAFITATLAYYSIRLSEENWHIRLLFFLGTILMLIVGANLAIEVVQANDPALSNEADIVSNLSMVYFGLIWFFFLTLAFMLIRFIFDMLKNIRGKQEEITP